VAVGALASQTTLDPRVIRKIAGEKGAQNSAFPKLYEQGWLNQDMVAFFLKRFPR
jgi:hypothetical protein